MHERAERLLGLLSVDDAAPARELERAFEARLAESSTLAYRVAFSVLRHRQDAEDVAQEAYVRAHRRFHQLRDRDRFRAWLVRMTWRLAIDHLRSAKRRTAREVFHATTIAASVDETAAAAERSAQLWAAIDALPDKLRIVVVLAAMDGHDIRAVAQLLALPEGTVKSRLFAARQKLKERLDA
jgi:RNA polymerase sigma-70 factor (ECF subfamily)